MSLASEIVGAVRISNVYLWLGGTGIRSTIRDTWRGVAFWRGGDGLSVAGDDSRNVWHDFVDDSGGGVLDLVVTVRGGTKQDALRWVAAQEGIAIEDKPLSAEDRDRWLEERHKLEQNLPDATYWRRAAVEMTEQISDSLKAALFAPTEGDVVVGQLESVYRTLQYLQRLDGMPLVLEFVWWVQHYPGFTAAMVRAAKEREKIAERALRRFLQSMEAAAA